MKNKHEDVIDITSQILAIQAADTPAVLDENIDMPCIVRGAGAGMNLTYLEIAKALGMGENKFPESNVKDLCNRSIAKFTRNFIFMLISDAAIIHGFPEEDAIEFAAQSYRLDKQLGKTDSQILARWL